MTTELIVTLALTFVATFAAATLFPFQSEVLLIGLILRDTVPLWLLITVASVGNTLGSIINWALGLGIERFKNRRWFPVSEKNLAKAQDWYIRYGVWSLLMSWAPGGGWVTLAAGVMRCPLGIFLIMVAIAKTVRYLVMTAIVLWFF